MTKVCYLDYAATTPVDARVITAMSAALGIDGDFANSGSLLHPFGQAALAQVDRARARLAEAVGASAEQLIFTSGATESNNLAILGWLRKLASRGKNHLITQATEHKAVLDVAKAWRKEGGAVTVLSVDAEGAVDLAALEAAIRPETALVSLMLVNNETGRLFPVAKVAALCHQRGVPIHTDAAQALGKVRLNLAELGVDFASLTAGKAYGPKGVGALYRREPLRQRLQPLMFGGGQEAGLRPGTLPTHQLVGFAEAAVLAVSMLDQERDRLRQLRARLWARLHEALVGIHLNTPLEDSAVNFLNISVEGVEGEALLLGLRHIAVASGSACSSGSLAPSHVLLAMGRTPELAASSLRISLGRYTQQSDVDLAAQSLIETITRLREIAAYGRVF